MAACRSLFTAGVRCFDMDFLATQEHELIVSHPDRLQVGFVFVHHVLGFQPWAALCLQARWALQVWGC